MFNEILSIRLEILGELEVKGDMENDANLQGIQAAKLLFTLFPVGDESEDGTWTFCQTYSLTENQEKAMILRNSSDHYLEAVITSEHRAKLPIGVGQIIKVNFKVAKITNDIAVPRIRGLSSCVRLVPVGELRAKLQWADFQLIRESPPRHSFK